MYCLLPKKKYAIYLTFFSIYLICFLNCKKIKLTVPEFKVKSDDKSISFITTYDGALKHAAIDMDKAIDIVKNKQNLETFIIERDLGFSEIRLNELFTILFSKDTFKVMEFKMMK